MAKRIVRRCRGAYKYKAKSAPKCGCEWCDAMWRSQVRLMYLAHERTKPTAHVAPALIFTQEMPRFVPNVPSEVDPRGEYSSSGKLSVPGVSWEKRADVDEGAGKALDRHYREVTATTFWEHTKSFYRKAYLALTNIMNGIAS